MSAEQRADLLEFGLLCGVVGALLLAAIVLVATCYWVVIGGFRLYRLLCPKESP